MSFILRCSSFSVVFELEPSYRLGSKTRKIFWSCDDKNLFWFSLLYRLVEVCHWIAACVVSPICKSKVALRLRWWKWTLQLGCPLYWSQLAKSQLRDAIIYSRDGTIWVWKLAINQMLATRVFKNITFLFYEKDFLTHNSYLSLLLSASKRFTKFHHMIERWRTDYSRIQVEAFEFSSLTAASFNDRRKKLKVLWTCQAELFFAEIMVPLPAEFKLMDCLSNQLSSKCFRFILFWSDFAKIFIFWCVSSCLLFD